MNVTLHGADFQPHPGALARRSILKGALAAPALIAAGLPAVASTETPIQRLYRQWEDVADDAERPGLTDEEGAALDAIRWPIEKAIAAEPVTDLRDLAIKVLVNSGEGSFGLDNAVTLECAALAGRDFDKLPAYLFTAEAA